MAKTIVSPQKTRPSPSTAAPRPALDVAAIKRSVEAEQRAFEEKMPSKKSKRRVGGSKVQRKRPESTRPERDSVTTLSSSSSKRGKLEAQEAHTTEQVAASFENVISTSSTEAAPSPHTSARAYVSGSETVEEQNPLRRNSGQLTQEGDSEENIEGGAAMARSVERCDEVPVAEQSGDGHDFETASGECEVPSDEGDDESQSWRRRAGRPPARAASAAAQSLLAAELAASEDVPTYSSVRAVRSRSNTSDPPSSRPAKRRAGTQSDQLEHIQSEEPYPLGGLTVDIMDESLVSQESSLQGDLDLEPKGEIADDEITSIGDATEPDDISSKAAQRLRPIRRSVRSSSRQSGGETADGSEVFRRASASPPHQGAEEKSEEPVARTTRLQYYPLGFFAPFLFIN
ncbi:hypothetical protein TELCIR_19308 [Teladorsagia circumcincta]|uniref:Uncharacterized protein n=1 Tax=Teladorsagia circumcincta TaxID=45464 RepID=A0A2G9TMS3_TELCI|nr:hypothetical protein TELCIR_19308 [Teladorsagia circumcincta]